MRPLYLQRMNPAKYKLDLVFRRSIAALCFKAGVEQSSRCVSVQVKPHASSQACSARADTCDPTVLVHSREIRSLPRALLYLLSLEAAQAHSESLTAAPDSAGSGPLAGLFMLRMACMTK